MLFVTNASISTDDVARTALQIGDAGLAHRFCTYDELTGSYVQKQIRNDAVQKSASRRSSVDLREARLPV